MNGEGAAVEVVSEENVQLPADISVALGDLAMPEGSRQSYREARVAMGTDQLVMDRYAYTFNTEPAQLEEG